MKPETQWPGALLSRVTGEIAAQELMQSQRIDMGMELLLLESDAQLFAPTNECSLFSVTKAIA